MKLNKFVVFIIIVVFTFITSLFVQNRISRKKLPILDLKKNVVIFGKIKQGNDFNKLIIYKNTGNGYLKINKITSTCGCTITKWNDKILKNNEIDTIFINYTADNLGAFIKSFYIFSNSSTSPDVVYIKGFCVK